ncbi:MAG: CPBP family intramembrane glutamic endopeptidase [Mucilaginibacter sp.]
MQDIQNTVLIDETDIAAPTRLQKRQYNTIIIAGVAIAVLFYPVFGTLVLSKSLLPVVRVFLSRIVIWATLPLVYQYAVKVEGRPFFLWKEKRQNIGFYIAAIIILFVLAYFAIFISAIPARLGFHDDYTAMKYWHKILASHIVLRVFVCITAGITEELLLRVYVLPRICLLFKSSYMPIIITSFLFSLMHLSYGNLAECIFTFVFGLICALCYYKYRNIKVLMIFHALYDLVVTR